MRQQRILRPSPKRLPLAMIFCIKRLNPHLAIAWILPEYRRHVIYITIAQFEQRRAPRLSASARLAQAEDLHGHNSMSRYDG